VKKKLFVWLLVAFLLAGYLGQEKPATTVKLNYS